MEVTTGTVTMNVTELCGAEREHERGATTMGTRTNRGRGGEGERWREWEEPQMGKWRREEEGRPALVAGGALTGNGGCAGGTVGRAAAMTMR